MAFSSVRRSEDPSAALNLSTQISATSLLRAASAEASLASRALAPVIQPPQVNPTTRVAATQATQAQKLQARAASRLRAPRGSSYLSSSHYNNAAAQFLGVPVS